MENMHHEAIANRTYSLTAYPLTRHKEYRYDNNCRCVRRDTEKVTVLASASSAANKHTSAVAAADGCQCRRIRCRTKQLFTKCYYYYYISCSTRLPLTANSHQHSRHNHHFHLKHFSLSYFPRHKLLTLFLVFSILANEFLAMALPTLHSSGGSKRWINPCNMNMQSINSAEGVSAEVDGEIAMEHYRIVSKSAQAARDQAQKAKAKFMDETFGDPSFLKEFEWLSYDWLPKIPPKHHIKDIDVRELLKKSYEYMQHYAVAIDQIVFDQILNDGNYVDLFREVDENLRSVLCPLHQAIIQLRIKPNQDVSREIMSEEYRSIESEVTRNVRDYIIMRDFVTALDYIYHAFRAQANKSTT